MPIELQPFEITKYDSKGKPIKVQLNPKCKATQTTPRLDLLKDPKEPLAIDIEFQECKRQEWAKWHHRIGRIAIVNTKGETIYDTYARYPDEEGLSCKVNPYFGVTWADLKIKNGAKRISQVESDLKKIMSGRIIVGHGMRLDMQAIDQKLWDKVEKIVDTQDLYGQVGLGKLVHRFLDLPGFMWHVPTADAMATMLLYLLKNAYDGRRAFGPQFNFVEEEFPALGTASPAKKNQ